MKLRLSFTVVLLSLVLASSGDELTGRVSAVRDGNMLSVITTNGAAFKLKLTRIDSHALDAALGRDAEDVISRLLLGKQVAFSIVGTDDAGRALADIRRLDGVNVFNELAKQRTGTVREDSSTSESAELAKETTSSTQDDSDTVYVTNTGLKYHKAGCRYLARSSIPIKLSDAQAKYTPCSICFPSEDISAATPTRGTGIDTGETTPTGKTIYEGPRGGRYHYSRTGKKVYEKR